MLESVLQWFLATGAASRASDVAVTVFFSVAGTLAIAPLCYIALVYFLDMRGKDITDI